MTSYRDIFDRLVMHLNYRWKLHKELFQISGQHEVLNKAGSNAWRLLEESLLDSVFLDIARLMDGEKSCGKDNLSMARVTKGIDRSGYAVDLDNDIAAAKVLYDSHIRQWRNQRLSHNDLATVSGQASLPAVPYDEIQELIDQINKVANSLMLVERDASQEYEPGVPATAWAPRLRRVLKLGVEQIEEHNKSE